MGMGVPRLGGEGNAACSGGFPASPSRARGWPAGPTKPRGSAKRGSARRPWKASKVGARSSQRGTSKMRLPAAGGVGEVPNGGRAIGRQAVAGGVLLVKPPTGGERKATESRGGRSPRDVPNGGRTKGRRQVAGGVGEAPNGGQATGRPTVAGGVGDSPQRPGGIAILGVDKAAALLRALAAVPRRAGAPLATPSLRGAASSQPLEKTRKLFCGSVASGSASLRHPALWVSRIPGP